MASPELLAVMPAAMVAPGSHWELRDPAFLWVALLAPLVYWLAARSPSRLHYSSVGIPRRAPASWRTRLVRLPALLLAAAWALLAVGLAGPRTGDDTSEIQREGIAIALVVDRSGSMAARDFVAEDRGVDRLEAVKRIVAAFVAGAEGLPGRPDDTIGLVSFARFADASAPLTLDHANLLLVLDQLEIVRDPSEDGTAVGEGLALAVERLRRNPAKSKVAILLTDGVSNAGPIDPQRAADLAADHDIRVYTIGAGRTGTAPVALQLPDGREVLRRMAVELDEETLVEVAKRTGGRYFHAADADALIDVYAEIDRLERSEIQEVRYLQYREHYGVWTGAALGCMGLASLLSATLLRRLP